MILTRKGPTFQQMTPSLLIVKKSIFGIYKDYLSMVSFIGLLLGTRFRWSQAMYEPLRKHYRKGVPLL